VALEEHRGAEKIELDAVDLVAPADLLDESEGMLADRLLRIVDAGVPPQAVADSLPQGPENPL
jgi:hypothetical protein